LIDAAKTPRAIIIKLAIEYSGRWRRNEEKKKRKELQSRYVSKLVLRLEFQIFDIS